MDFDTEFEKRYGIPANHALIKGQVWKFTKFDSKEFDNLGIKWGGTKYNQAKARDKVEKIFEEMREKPKTTITPKLITLPKLKQKVLQIQSYNVLLNAGLEESAKRDTKEASPVNGVTHVGLGTDGTAELETQTGLISATGNRKEYDVDGSRTVPTGTQTAKYFMLFDADADGYTLPVTLREGAQYNQLAGGIAHSRVKYPDFLLESGEAILSQINETHANG